MRRGLAISVLTLSAWIALGEAADAQCIITPAGPVGLALVPSVPSDRSLDTDLVATPQASDDLHHPLKTPVARGGEGPHRALPPRDYSRGVCHAG